jgi:hypothetical protein
MADMTFIDHPVIGFFPDLKKVLVCIADEAPTVGQKLPCLLAISLFADLQLYPTELYHVRNLFASGSTSPFEALLARRQLL